MSRRRLPVMKDFFHFNLELAPAQKIAQLLAQLHALPTKWYEPLKQQFLARDPHLGQLLRDASSYAPCWCLPWSGIDTGMLLLGVGNPNPETAKRLLDLEVESGVYEKVMLHEAFQPVSKAGQRQVVVHNDFKPDNVLRDPSTGALTAIDYDLVQVGPAVMDFGLPYMMWLGSRFTTFEFRQTFIEDYLTAAGQPNSKEDVRAMMSTEQSTPSLRSLACPISMPRFHSCGVSSTQRPKPAQKPAARRLTTGLELANSCGGSR